MTNSQVIQNFLHNEEGRTPLRQIGIYKGRTLYTIRYSGNKLVLINYETPIALLQNGTLYINKNKYSVTTTKIQNQIKSYANYCYFELTEIELKNKILSKNTEDIKYLY